MLFCLNYYAIRKYKYTATSLVVFAFSQRKIAQEVKEVFAYFFKSENRQVWRGIRLHELRRGTETVAEAPGGNRKNHYTQQEVAFREHA